MKAADNIDDLRIASCPERSVTAGPIILPTALIDLPPGTLIISGDPIRRLPDSLDLQRYFY
jgi:hypothetical protein